MSRNGNAAITNTKAPSRIGSINISNDFKRFKSIPYGMDHTLLTSLGLWISRKDIHEICSISYPIGEKIGSKGKIGRR